MILNKKVSESVIMEYISKHQININGTNKIVPNKNTSFVLDADPNQYLINHDQLINEVQFEKEQTDLLYQFKNKYMDLQIWSPMHHEVILLILSDCI